MTRPLDVRFFVPGDCVPKGSHSAYVAPAGRCTRCKPGKHCGAKNCFGGTIVRAVVGDQQGGDLTAWQRYIEVSAISARNAAAQRVVAPPGAVEIVTVFVVARPSGHWTESGALTSEGRARPHPTVKPDLDKYERATLDGLTGALVRDDAQVVSARMAKVYAPWRGKTGVAIRARLISSLDSWVAHELDYAGIATASPQAVLL